MSLRSEILDFMKKVPRQQVELESLTTEFNCYPRQAQQVMSYAIRKNLLPGLKVLERGQQWSYGDIPETVRADKPQSSGPIDQNKARQDRQARDAAQAAAYTESRTGPATESVHLSNAFAYGQPSAAELMASATEHLRTKYPMPERDLSAPHGWTGGEGKYPLLKVVHKTKRGTIVLEDYDGFLWIAQRTSS